MEVITSSQNAKVKQARALRQRKHRQASGTFLVEGIRHVGEAVEAGARIEALFYAPDLLQSEFGLTMVEELSLRGVPTYALSEGAFASLAEKENPAGLLAIVQIQTVHLGELNPLNFPWGVAVISPQDPGNIGTILRTIDAAGSSGLLLLQGGADPYHASAVRASMGALFWHPVISAGFDEFDHWVSSHGYHVYGSSAHGNRDYGEIDRYKSPAILLLGSEREGLTDEQAKVCEEILHLPMHGRVTSLNLAVAASILLYAMAGDLRKDLSS